MCGCGKRGEDAAFELEGHGSRASLRASKSLGHLETNVHKQWRRSWTAPSAKARCRLAVSGHFSNLRGLLKASWSDSKPSTVLNLIQVGLCQVQEAWRRWWEKEFPKSCEAYLSRPKKG